MKNDFVKFRVNKKEKKEIERQAKQDGLDSMSAYLLFLHRQNMKKFCANVLIFFFLFSTPCFAFTDNQIADAIFKAEGGWDAQYLYGIRSVSYDTPKEARRICMNTIRNNRKRFLDYGHKSYRTYLDFLASRYAPIGADNDPRGLNNNWLKNVKWFLNKE